MSVSGVMSFPVCGCCWWVCNYDCYY